MHDVAPVRGTHIGPRQVATPAPAPPQPARAITSRDWARIAKDPESHVDDSIVVYGQVTQFDAATGDGVFRADVDGVKHSVSYGYADYETGSISDETTLGGNMTAPQLSVTKLAIIGAAK